MKEVIIKPSTLYSVSNGALDFANYHLNGVAKKYMEKKMLPQKEPIDFPEKFKRRVDFFKEEHDILLSMPLMNNIASYWGKDMDMKDPDINISFVDFSDFPKTMLIYGSREMFTGAVEELIDKMNDAGVDLTVYKGEIHCHDWVLANTFPESKKMLNKMCDFIN